MVYLLYEKTKVRCLSISESYNCGYRIHILLLTLIILVPVHSAKVIYLNVSRVI